MNMMNVKVRGMVSLQSQGRFCPRAACAQVVSYKSDGIMRANYIVESLAGTILEKLI